jgi:hypothetical protein
MRNIFNNYSTEITLIIIQKIKSYLYLIISVKFPIKNHYIFLIELNLIKSSLIKNIVNNKISDYVNDLKRYYFHDK